MCFKSSSSPPSTSIFPMKTTETTEATPPHYLLEGYFADQLTNIIGEDSLNSDKKETENFCYPKLAGTSKISLSDPSNNDEIYIPSKGKFAAMQSANAKISKKQETCDYNSVCSLKQVTESHVLNIPNEVNTTGVKNGINDRPLQKLVDDDDFNNEKKQNNCLITNDDVNEKKSIVSQKRKLVVEKTGKKRGSPEGRQKLSRASDGAADATFPDPFTKKPKMQRKGLMCSCKNSLCLKKYCQCFQASVKCTSRCRCVNCQNGEDDRSSSDGSAVKDSSDGVYVWHDAPRLASPSNNCHDDLIVLVYQGRAVANKRKHHRIKRGPSGTTSHNTRRS